MGRPKKYFTEEERKEAKRERERRSYQKNKEKILEKHKQWREAHPEYFNQYYQEHKEEFAEYQQEHKEEIAEYKKQYSKTPMGRAAQLLSGYQNSDKKYGRGKCTLTSQWIVDNIFTKKCHWCPETDWMEMGCDRIDNALPHTPDNVIPCCKACNSKRGTMSYEVFKKALRAEETTL